MAALVAGVQYGLSSHSKITENKSLIFVKLTDSAQRAIEDFLRNRNKTNQNPTIQFLGNEGQLSFPSTQSSHGTAGFTFSLSGNQDIEGPQGGFECIQQTGPKSLESLGTLPCKMRIQANDDVYETTRHRMAVADENNKMKCTRVIKANGPDIGRKVKVKATGRTIPPPIPNARHRESTSIPTSSSQSSRSQSSAPPAPPTTTSSSSSSSFSSYKPIQNSNPPPNRTQPEKKVSDLMRRPLRERLIHLLALRPYKRPELYNRITTEGIKERDRSTTNLVLKQVAFMRDNTYHLLRHVWNDVQEDWPFYTEQEKAMLKRRKPQNLTPPGSSDGGSSGSGQSPNSTHAGSPPAITAPPPGLMSLKRPGYYQSADGLQTKKPRISHFRKSDSSATTGSSNSNGNRESARTTVSSSSGGGGGGGSGQVAGPPPASSVGSGGGSVVVSGSGLGSVGSENNSWEQRQQRQHQQQPQQRDRAEYRAERTTNSDVLRGSGGSSGGGGSGSGGGGGGSGGGYGSAKSCLTPTSDSEDNNHSGHGHNNHHSSANATGGSTGANSGNGGGGGNGGSGGGGSGNVSGNGSGSGGNYPGSNHHSNSSLSYNNNPAASNHHHSVNGNSSKAAIGAESNSAGGGAAAVGSLGVVNFVRSSTGTSASSHGNNGSSPNGVIERRDREDRGSSRAYEREQREREREMEREYERDRESRENSGAAGTNSYNDFPNPAVNENSANIVGTISSPPASDNVGSTEDTEYPDYLTYYTTISSTEQRRRYKNEFSADYEEYRTLHTEVGRVAERFTRLEAQWRRELQNGNHERTQVIAIKNQIMQAYAETRNDPVHKETKRRFDYLHKKLSHIKQLVHEYDTKNLSGNGGAGGGGGGNGGTDVGLRGGLRN